MNKLLWQRAVVNAPGNRIADAWPPKEATPSPGTALTLALTEVEPLVILGNYVLVLMDAH